MAGPEGREMGVAGKRGRNKCFSEAVGGVTAKKPWFAPE